LTWIPDQRNLSAQPRTLRTPAATCHRQPLRDSRWPIPQISWVCAASRLGVWCIHNQRRWSHVTCKSKPPIDANGGCVYCRGASRCCFARYEDGGCPLLAQSGHAYQRGSGASFRPCPQRNIRPSWTGWSVSIKTWPRYLVCFRGQSGHGRGQPSRQL